MIYAAVGLILSGIVIWILQFTKGYFTRKRWFRHVPKFLIANGALLPVPMHAFADGLAVFLLWLVVSEISHHRRKNAAVEAVE